MGFFDGIVDAQQQLVRKATIHTAVNAGGSAQAASFTVDVEQIPGLIAKYEEAQEKLEAILTKAQQLRKIGVGVVALVVAGIGIEVRGIARIGVLVGVQ